MYTCARYMCMWHEHEVRWEKPRALTPVSFCRAPWATAIQPKGGTTREEAGQYNCPVGTELMSFY